MARFTFKFETVLKQRERQEEVCQRELAQVLRLRMILIEQLKQMQGTITQSKHELAGSLVGRVDMDQVGAFARYSGQTAQQARGIVVRLSGLEKQVEAARAKLLAATAAKKAMELLKERHRKQWEEEENRRENNRLDDLTTSSYARAVMGRD